MSTTTNPMTILVAVGDSGEVRKCAAHVPPGWERRGHGIWTKGGHTLRIAWRSVSMAGLRADHALLLTNHPSERMEARIRLEDPANWHDMRSPSELAWRVPRLLGED